MVLMLPRLLLVHMLPVMVTNDCTYEPGATECDHDYCLCYDRHAVHAAVSVHTVAGAMSSAQPGHTWMLVAAVTHTSSHSHHGHAVITVVHVSSTG